MITLNKEHTLKILFINSVIGYGSTGRITQDLYNEVKIESFEAMVAYGRKSKAIDVDTYKIGSKLSMLFHVFLTRVFDKHGLGSSVATKKLVAFIKDYNPDIIHLHNIHGYYVNVKMLFRYLANTDAKIFWSLHDCWSMTGHCAHFDHISCDKWKANCHHCPEKKAYPASLVFDSSSQNYKLKKALFTSLKNLTIITPSNWLTGIVKQSYLKNYDVKTINNGIDLSVFKPVPSDIKEKFLITHKKIVLGIASPFTDNKGFSDFIRLGELLPKNYVIVMIGVSEKQIKSLGKNIIGISRISDKAKIVKLYSSAHVFFNPTKADTYPTTIMESLACGTPVVSYDVGGCSELVDNTCGKLVKKDSIIDAKDAIIEVSEKSNMFENCIKKASAFDKNVQVNKTYSLYLE
jgi:putative colanic acid biosynthesis glycosyltransferase